MSLNLSLLDAIVQQPDWVAQELAERSLHEFIRQMWDDMDQSAYQDGWHIRVICEHLEAVMNGEIQKLIINIPPRHMKSLAVGVALPAWTWARRPAGPLIGPATRFLYASYAHSLSIRDSRKCRALIESPAYQHRWGHRFKLVGDQNTKIRYDNDQKGYRLATSVGGSLTGEGADCIVIDDPHNAVEVESDLQREAVIEWWRNSMSSRRNSPKTGAFIVIMQRVHEEDLTGHLLEGNDAEEWMDGIERDPWQHLCLPARYELDHPHVSIHDIRTDEGQLLWEEQFDEAYMSEQEMEMGSHVAAGQLQQSPHARKGGMFQRHWWKYAEAAPQGVKWIRAYDIAGTEDGGNWTVGGLVGYNDGTFYVDDVVRDQLSPGGVDDLIENNAALDGPEVEISLPQDGGQAGKGQVRTWKQLLVGYNVHTSVESGKKTKRAQPVSVQAEAGNIVLIRGKWNKVFIDEFTAFREKCKYDDQVDMLSRGFHRHVELRGRKRRMTGRGGVRVYRDQ